MDTYSLEKFGQMRREELVRSVPPANLDEPIMLTQPGWLSAKLRMIAAHLQSSAHRPQPTHGRLDADTHLKTI